MGIKLLAAAFGATVFVYVARSQPAWLAMTYGAVAVVAFRMGARLFEGLWGRVGQRA